MKVGIICPYNMYKGGGVQECVVAIRKELENRGHTAKIISPTPPRVKNPEMEGVIFIGTAAQVKAFHTTSQVSVNVRTDALKTALDREKFDILHFHEPWVPNLSRQILAHSNSLNVATFHAKLPDTLMVKTIEKVVTPYTKSVLKDLERLTAVSDAAAMYVSNLTSKNVEIIPNGIDLSKYKPSNTKRDNSILFIGRIEKRKGLKYLIDAFKEIQDKSTNLIIAGDGPDRRKMEKYVATIGIEDRVEFLGFISEAEKLNLFNKCSLVCSPALFGESFGIVLLEAMAMGVPIIAGNNPGYSSVLRDEGSLSLVNPKDTLSFTRLINTFMSNQRVRELWLGWASNYVKQFDYPLVVNQYESLYKELLEQK
jgi:phosphatidylinositol alpha-mannosyltransferase